MSSTSALGAAAGEPATAAVLADPDGRRVRVIHRYRRSPLLSLAVTVPEPLLPAAEAFYAAELGMERVVPYSGAHDESGAVVALGAAGQLNATQLLLVPPRGGILCSAGVLLFGAPPGSAAAPRELMAPGGVRCVLL